ncbi:purine nucleoside phosphorylase DeoD-type [Companilactobacillus sp. RD055328]|uniref:purine-nucleoside phosphorylase n=1 Tax=Companilactobacillus sp. RD055328 TaxID=2916634 RepID=UPI001FC8E273|nr:purine-nucleoside phosphorylase [Companilactobacillus sp. RD055328]GKQ42436.1 purine nucleoside phosphorylase DeoD-type [Companilactobacillus sp. RD055328]
MSTHINAQRDDIAEIVLLPGDPLRAKYIAETFLEDVTQYNTVRNAFGYTGMYKGVRISVQSTGMGMPSMSIYATELIQNYGVKQLIRVGTMGGIGKNINVRDVVIAQATSTDSAMAENIFDNGIHFAPIADFEMIAEAAKIAQNKNISVKVGNILTEDRFYNDEINREKLASYGIMGCEMETAALYILAAKYDVKALSILTISNHIITGEETTSKERETTFNDMINIALETAISTK